MSQPIEGRHICPTHGSAGSGPCPWCEEECDRLRSRVAELEAATSRRDVLAVVDAARKHADWHNNKGPDEDDGLAELLAKLDWEGG